MIHKKACKQNISFPLLFLISSIVYRMPIFLYSFYSFFSHFSFLLLTSILLFWLMITLLVLCHVSLFESPYTYYLSSLLSPFLYHSWTILLDYNQDKMTDEISINSQIIQFSSTDQWDNWVNQTITNLYWWQETAVSQIYYGKTCNDSLFVLYMVYLSFSL